MGRRQTCVALAVAAVLSVVATLGGCGTASPKTSPTGIDEMVVPTPSPDPADYVRGIDNPWLPYAPGATWTYEVSGADSGSRTVTVLDSEHSVAGVDTTSVARTEPSGKEVVDYFAQDRAGNVWWFGREGQWQAGEDGAQAGLAMPARPRLGDGWRAAYAPGVVDVRASVVATDESVTTPAGRFTELLTLEVRDGAGNAALPATQAMAGRSYYARGMGLVAEAATEGPTTLTELVTGPDGSR